MAEGPALTLPGGARRLAGDFKDMARSLRQIVVVLLILLWNTAGVYRTVCEALCAEDDCPQVAGQTSPGEIAFSSSVRSGGPGGPASPHSRCPASLQPMKCVEGPGQVQLCQSVSLVQSLLAAVTSVAVPLALGASSPTHSPPGFQSGRSICSKLTLLRI